MNKIFLDYASGTPIDPDILGAISDASLHEVNPSGLYMRAVQAQQVLSDARARVADSFDAKPSEIVFTGSCTESDNLAVRGIMQQFTGKKVLYSAVEHDAVAETASLFDAVVVEVDDCGRVNLSDLETKLDDDVVLISIMAVNNETGVIQPLKEIAEILDAKRQMRGKNGLPLFFHVDAAQAPNILPVTKSSMYADLVSISSGKIYGPRGASGIYIRSGVSIAPQLSGGGQEQGRRSGTENVPAILGFSIAFQKAQSVYRNEAQRLTELQRLVENALVEMGGVILSSGAERSPAITMVHFDGVDNEYLLYQLDERGVEVATGSACHAKKAEPSRVLGAMGYDHKFARSCLRLSYGRYTDEDQCARAINVFRELLAPKKP